MNKIDLIIDNIMYAKLVKEQAHIDELLEEALAAARELKELKPVAWKSKNRGLYTFEPPATLMPTPLYALDEHSNFVSSGTAYPIIDAVTK
jgi:hypothetical protein